MNIPVRMTLKNMQATHVLVLTNGGNETGPVPKVTRVTHIRRAEALPIANAFQEWGDDNYCITPNRRH